MKQLQKRERAPDALSRATQILIEPGVSGNPAGIEMPPGIVRFDTAAIQKR
jgi:hypothetical protein